MKHPVMAAVAVAATISSAADAQVALQPVGRYQAADAVFNSGAAEIVAYDAATRRIFVVNAQLATVDVLNAANPASLEKVGQIDLKQIQGASLGAANSVAARDGLVAVAVEASPITDPGLVAFFDAATLKLLTTVATGALPDAVTFANTGHFVVTSNEGESRRVLVNGQPVIVDPEGSITIVDVRRRGNKPSFSSCTADFKAFNSQRDALLADGVIIDPRAASVAQDLEPEYAAVQGNNAYVTMQENNAVAWVQLNSCQVKRIAPLGAKDLSLAQNSLDTSDQEISSSRGRIQLRSWGNLFGLYQPDSIAAFEAADGETYLVIANEGDVRDNESSGQAGSDAARVSSLPLDPVAFPAALDVKANKNLGRLNVNRLLGCKLGADGKPLLDANGNCTLYDRLFAYGGRSFSILTNDGRMVFDSGNQIESIIASLVCPAGAAVCDKSVYPLAKQAFNANHSNNAPGAVAGESNNTFDTRSDDKGPEPEGVAVGQVGDRTYAFIGLERVGGVMVFDVTDPAGAFYVDYLNFRNFDQPVCTAVSGSGACSNGVPNPLALDLGPEGLAFVPAQSSPNGRPLLIVGNEISGSTTVYEVVSRD